jgi:carboxyl-terminal processing protease
MASRLLPTRSFAFLGGDATVDAMARLRAASLVSLAVVVLGCSGSGPTTGKPTPRANQPVSMEDQPPPDPREQRLSMAVVQLLEQEHLRHRKVDDAASRATFAKYLEGLDPGKMFLLKSDVAALEPHRDTVDDELRSGRLDLAHEGQALYTRRVKVVEKVVADLLAKPLDSNNEEFFETDPKKVELAASEDELRERWRRRLELEVLERVSLMEERAADLAKKDKAKDDKDKTAEEEDQALVRGPIPPTPEGREAKAREDLAKSYAGRFARLATPGPLDAAASLMNALTSTFDPHTNYLPPADKANFDIQMSGSLEGIGAVLREDDHYIRVVEVVPGGASWRQGKLEAGDLILSVAQKGKDPVDTTDMRIDEVVKMIRGPKGTLVTLVVKKPSEELETISITRDVVVIEESYARGAVLQPAKAKRGFGYINLPSFYGAQRGGPPRSASTDVRRLLEEMQKRNVAGVVIDLRANGGGLLGDSVDLTGLLIDKGPVVQTQVSDGTKKTLADSSGGTSFSGPVVVMVDRFSASASEIVAGALQDYKRAVIIGTSATHGKGTVQVLADLAELTGSGDDLGALKVTVQQFFRVSGASTQWQGVVPDIVLPDPSAHIESGERELENSIPWSQITAVPHDDWNVTWKVADLAAKSAKRIAKSDVFGKISAQTQLLMARRDDTKVPLAKTAWLTKREEQKKALDAVSPHLDKGPKRFGVTPVEYASHTPVAARPGGKTDDRAGRWRDIVARDPWIEEAVFVLADMAAPGH